MELNESELVEWFKKAIAEVSGIAENMVDLKSPISTYELDSLSVVSITYELENYLGIEIDPTIFSEFQTIEELIAWLKRK